MSGDMGGRIAFVCAFCCLTGYSFGQRPFVEINTEYQVNPYADMKISHALYFQGDSSLATLEVLFNNDLGPENFHPLRYFLYEDYQSDEPIRTDSLDMGGGSFLRDQQRSYYHIGLPSNTRANLLVVQLARKDAAWKYSYGIPLDPELNYGRDALMIHVDSMRPLLRSFVHQNETIRLTTLEGRDTTVFAYYYSDDFNEALPPMVTESDNVRKGLTVDSTFAVPTNTDLVLPARGLYFFQLDTASLEGIAIRSVDPYYPSLTKIEDLIEPLLYISTREEMETLMGSPDKKEAFEAYWVDQAGSPSKASEMIRKYYDQTEEANYFFTTFKEGWKTDMGMIYIVYGKPDEVYNNEETVEWVYNSQLTMPIIRFSFIKVKNIFSDEHYTLLRKNNHDRHWFVSVKQWRDGKK